MSKKPQSKIYNLSTSKTNQTRASFFNLSSDLKHLKFDRDENSFYFLPYFEIQNNEIDIKKFTPVTEGVKQQNFTIKPFLEYNHMLLESKVPIEKSCMAVGQIIALFQDRNFPHYKLTTESATFSVLKINKNKLVGLSVFHLQNDYPSSNFFKYYFVHFSEKNFLYDIVIRELENIYKNTGIENNFI
jgi:hypothetical protein